MSERVITGLTYNASAPEETWDRRNVLHAGAALLALLFTAILNLGCTNHTIATHDAERPLGNPPNKTKNNTFMGTVMHIQYLEIVTTDVETACALYSKMHGVTFSDPDQ